MPEAAPTSPPYRLIGRLMTEFLVRATATLAEPHGADLTQTLAFTTIVCANVSHLPYASPAAARAAEGLDAIDEGLRRPLSVNAVARSLDLPFETVRLRIHRLEAMGLCERTPSGVFVAPSVMMGPAVGEVWMVAYALLRDILRRLQQAGVDLDGLVSQLDDSAAPACPPPPMVAMRIALDSVLRVLERFGTIFGGLNRGYLFSAIVSANTRHFDEPPYPPLAYAYLETPPPDSLRRPVSIRGMARDLGLPVETTRRNAERLIQDGWVLRAEGGGLIVPAAALNTSAAIELSQATALNTVRMLTELRRAGVRLGSFDASPTEIGAPGMATTPPV